MAFDYQSLIDEAMLDVIKKILFEVRDEGLTSEQSFYISFRTNSKGVVLSKSVKDKYPKEITIVLQHQFRNLAILNDKFTVNISFGGASENIEVPFVAITSFLDPLANFGFQFASKKILPLKDTSHDKQAEILSAKSRFVNRKISKVYEEGDIVAIDQFRKKRDEKNQLV